MRGKGTHDAKGRPCYGERHVWPQGSKSLSKRKREVESEEQVERDARQLRRDMRQRGHVVRTQHEILSQGHALRVKDLRTGLES